MSQKLSPKDIAEQIYQLVGEKQNLSQVAHCMTRLRLNILDMELVKIEEIKKIDGVMGVVEQGGQLQIILGPGRVNKVTQEFGLISGVLSIGELDEAAARKSEVNAKMLHHLNCSLRRYQIYLFH